MPASAFPEPITSLPQADIPLPGLKAYLSQGADHQILFMEFSAEVEVGEHAHASQWGMVVAGRIDLELGGGKKSYGPGDHYFIPAGVVHAAKIYAGYADISFFAEPARYKAK